jgi:hypothetical protein
MASRKMIVVVGETDGPDLFELPQQPHGGSRIGCCCVVLQKKFRAKTRCAVSGVIPYFNTLGVACR